MIDKTIFEEQASILGNWQEVDKNQLCFEYCKETDKTKQEAYLSAIICKYWNSIQKYYNKSKGFATIEDCYDVVIDAIQNILERRAWEDSSKKIYNDKNGPDKAINRCIKTSWLNSYIASMRDKRICNTNALYFDGLDAPVQDTIEFKVDETRSIEQETLLYQLVTRFFNDKDYIGAFSVDFIANGDVFERENNYTQFSDKKLIKCLHNITSDYIIIFAKEYEIPKEKVIIAVEYVKRQKTEVLREHIQKILLKIKQLL